jgi:tetratricopeptide (TPR) repeat protein
VWAQLANEYRRLAQEALARGDFRRAAYLYGVLLRDLRSAANALSSGGLHKDAAILYRDKLNDPLAAAQSFERAGNIEESLRLYEKMERYEEAAEMLRRMGNDERAEQLYIRAAHAHANRNHWVAAGDLVRTKIGRHDLAEEFYRSGWKFMGAEVVPCGQRLLDQSLASQEWTKAEELFAEAEERFSARTQESNSFFNYALRLKETLPEPKQEDWHDRVRSLFADQVHQSVKSVPMAGELFADRQNWPAEVLRDAIYAAKAGVKTPTVETLPERAKKLLDGTVVAVAVARDSRDIIVASTTNVVCWRVKEQRVQVLLGSWIQNEVIGLSVDSNADNVFVLSHNGPKITLQAFQNHVAEYFKEGGKVEFDIENTERGEWYLSPFADTWKGGPPEATMANRSEILSYRGHIPKAEGNSAVDEHSTTHLILRLDPNSDDLENTMDWYWNSGGLEYLSGDWQIKTKRKWQPHWHPDVPRGNPILVSPMDVITKPGTLEIAAVDQKGILCWSRFEANTNEEHPNSHQLFSHHPDRFAAACLLKENTIAAVTFKNELLWYRVQTGKLETYAPGTPLDVPSKAVFLVARPQAREVAAILEDGSAVLVPMP